MIVFRNNVYNFTLSEKIYFNDIIGISIKTSIFQDTLTEQVVKPVLSKESSSGNYNTVPIPTIALTSLRHHTGLRETAEIATATLIDFKVITADDHKMTVDHNKVILMTYLNF